MPRDVVIIGAGVGGLAASIRLAQHGCRVTVFEARDGPGGLAAGVEYGGQKFDAGPYVLLDRPGLQWAFEQLDMDLVEQTSLQRIRDVYRVDSGDDPPVSIFDSLEQTCGEMEKHWPGSAVRYRRFVTRMQDIYKRLQPLQRVSRPGLRNVLKTGAWRHVFFLSRSLRSVLSSTKLPAPVTRALGIWTHVAGQTMSDAPSPLALVPYLIHSAGAYYPAQGIGTVTDALYTQAEKVGVTFQFNRRVTRICCRNGAVSGVELEGEELHSAGAVISNVGLATYLKLSGDEASSRIPGTRRKLLRELPLQSPGVCVYLAVRGAPCPPYLKFQLHDEQDGCRLLVAPAAIQQPVADDQWRPARLIVPMSHRRAESGGERAQNEFLQKILEESWWRRQFDETRVLGTRIPMQWGTEYHLFKNSMNPVMTARFMRAGRLAHRSRWIRGLYLAGSATHPGQWVSFCAVSGVLSADQLLKRSPAEAP